MTKKSFGEDLAALITEHCVTSTTADVVQALEKSLAAVRQADAEINKSKRDARTTR